MVYVLAGKYFVRGLTAGAVKGWNGSLTPETNETWQPSNCATLHKGYGSGLADTLQGHPTEIAPANS